ncbi:MAG: hypothetical protein AAGE52_16590 [Myxococcota bacterium]
MARTLSSFLLLVACTASAAAQTNDRARAHFRAGQSLTEAGSYAEAYVEFAAGYSLSRRPLFLFNMAECSFELDRLDEARSEYERYLTEDPEGRMVALARARLRDLPVPEPVVEEPAAEVPVVDVEPARVAEAAVTPTDEAGAYIETRPPLRRRWQLWTAVGASAAAVAIAVAVGVAVGGGSNGCGANCSPVDFR